ncbi:MAG: phosphatidate cytidylyltransferase [Spirochaetaceae bacterium]|jgi:dolichol kinase|nr:phosphatidate cytidylyltransferase [Spirochaetaceae bacterium]
MISVKEIKNVVVRKCLHFLIAFAPALAALNYPASVLLISAGTVFYAFVESFRASGAVPAFWKPVRFISRITIFASHRRDKNRYVLGPLTLGAGALAALILFPPPAAAAAIYALAAGDGLAGLAGRLFGRIRPRFLNGKSLEGSATCFAAVFVVVYAATGGLKTAFVAAFMGMAVEALPLEDFDNIALPFIVGSIAAIGL